MKGKYETFKSLGEFEKKHGKITGQVQLNGRTIIFTKEATFSTKKPLQEKRGRKL